jgi:hypothetical protein
METKTDSKQINITLQEAIELKMPLCVKPKVRIAAL